MSVTRRTVQSWLTGTSQPKADQIYRLSKVMNVTPNELFFLIGEDEAEESMMTRVCALVDDLPKDHRIRLLTLVDGWIEVTKPHLGKI